MPRNTYYYQRQRNEIENYDINRKTVRTYASQFKNATDSHVYVCECCKRCSNCTVTSI